LRRKAYRRYCRRKSADCSSSKLVGRKSSGSEAAKPRFYRASPPPGGGPFVCFFPLPFINSTANGTEAHNANFHPLAGFGICGWSTPESDALGSGLPIFIKRTS